MQLHWITASFVHDEAKSTFGDREIWLLASDPRDLANKCIDILPGDLGECSKLPVK